MNVKLLIVIEMCSYLSVYRSTSDKLQIGVDVLVSIDEEIDWHTLYYRIYQFHVYIGQIAILTIRFDLGKQYYSPLIIYTKNKEKRSLAIFM